MIVARLAGIRVFATGGIGGVHRGAEPSFDISADLTELARTDVTVVAAGAKALLDLPKTLEVLETLGRAGGLLRQRRSSPPSGRATSGLTAPIRLDDAGGDRRLHPRARGARPRPAACSSPIPVPAADEIPAAEMAPHIEAADRRQRARRHHRQGGDALPARRDPQAHRRAEPRHQHRAGQEQRAPRGRDRGGAGERGRPCDAVPKNGAPELRGRSPLPPATTRR